ncbi:MAG: hypothetical protein V4525_04415 [Pseudomonadota bacterium]
MKKDQPSSEISADEPVIQPALLNDNELLKKDIAVFKFNRRDFYDIFLYAIFGGIGGFTAWLISNNNFSTFDPQLLCFIFFGGLSAIVGIFLLSLINVNNTKQCIALAILFGILWKVIFDSGKFFIEDNYRRQQIKLANHLAEEAIELSLDLQKKPIKVNQDSIKHITLLTLDMLNSAKLTNDYNVIESAKFKSALIVKHLESLKNKENVSNIIIDNQIEIIIFQENILINKFINNQKKLVK